LAVLGEFDGAGFADFCGCTGWFGGAGFGIWGGV